ncbi:tRNA pseudouridine(38-40) synthase TruA [Bacteroidia bacterium]|nr:tRNA pseudouridine(38-40) synthase TruA [Bacteroidia bacterium]
MNYCVRIAYNGADYSGWQRQKNAVSLQQTIEEALTKLIQEPIQIIGCGRTDAGVHALSYYFNFKTAKDLPEHILFKLNAMCPHDIAFFDLWEVPREFHARFEAKERSYKYFLHTSKNPFQQGLSLLYSHKLDLDKMNEACKLIIGKHDFTSFAKTHTEVNNFYCTIEKAQWTLNGESQIVFEVTANRFLRNMVRALVGTILEVGIGRKDVSFINEVLSAKDRSAAGQSMPGHALYLSQIKYDQNLWQKRT